MAVSRGWKCRRVILGGGLLVVRGSCLEGRFVAELMVDCYISWRGGGDYGEWDDDSRNARMRAARKEEDCGSVGQA